MMARHYLTDDQWKRLHPLLPPQKPHIGRPATDQRTVVNAILWLLKTGAPWRDLPSEKFGSWKTIYNTFSRWRDNGIWQHVVAELERDAAFRKDINWKLHFVDSTIVRTHQHGACVKRGISKPSAVVAAATQRKSMYALKAKGGRSPSR
jgi:transposase